MTKRARAFELFKQGKKPDDLEVLALELRKRTARRYYKEFLHPELVTVRRKAPAKALAEVTVGSLQLRQLFTYNGATYRLHTKEISQVHVLLLEMAPSGQYPIEEKGRYLSLDTLVKVI